MDRPCVYLWLGISLPLRKNTVLTKTTNSTIGRCVPISPRAYDANYSPGRETGRCVLHRPPGFHPWSNVKRKRIRENSTEDKFQRPGILFAIATNFYTGRGIIICRVWRIVRCFPKFTFDSCAVHNILRRRSIRGSTHCTSRFELRTDLMSNLNLRRVYHGARFRLQFWSFCFYRRPTEHCKNSILNVYRQRRI